MHLKNFFLCILKAISQRKKHWRLSLSLVIPTTRKAAYTQKNFFAFLNYCDKICNDSNDNKISFHILSLKTKKTPLII